MRTHAVPKIKVMTGSHAGIESTVTTAHTQDSRSRWEHTLTERPRSWRRHTQTHVLTHKVPEFKGMSCTRTAYTDPPFVPQSVPFPRPRTEPNGFNIIFFA